MKVFGLIFIIFCIGAWIAFPYVWKQHYPSVSGTWRYKVTVTVETPEGIKAGSAVREVGMESQPFKLPDTAPVVMAMVKGEAVVVDLGKRGILFAVTGGVDDYNIALNALHLSRPTTSDGIRHFRPLENAKAILPIGYTGRLIHFKDINDPKTVEQWCDTAYCTEIEKVSPGKKLLI